MEVIEIKEDMKLIENYIELKDYESALKGLDSLILKNEDKADYFYFKAFCYIQLNKLEEATKETKNAILKGYLSDDCMKILQNIYNKMGEKHDAQEYFIKELIFYPTSEDEFLRIAYIKFFMETSDNGRKFIKRAIKISSTNPKILRYAFDYYGNKGFERELQKVLEKYLECDVSEVSKLEINGDYEVYLKNHKKALEYFDKASLIDPNNALIQDKIEKAKKNSGILIKSRNIFLRILEFISVIVAIIIFLFLFAVTHSIIISGLIAFILCNLALLSLREMNK